MPQRLIVMMKWGVGYPAGAFNRTYKALKDHADEDVEIACITDDPTGLDGGMEVIQMPDIPLERARWDKGMWPKICLFKDGVIDPEMNVLFVDVDIAVVGDLSGLFALNAPDIVNIYKDEKTYHAKWFPRLFAEERGGNSSVVGFIAGHHGALWHAFSEDPEKVLQDYENDQDFITRKAPTIRYFPEGWISSFKKAVAPLPPVAWFSRCAPKADVKIVAFHGKPDIDDLTRRNNSRLKLIVEGFGVVPWIERYLDKYDPVA